MSATSELQSRFARAVEAEYETRAAAYLASGLSPEQAHQRALEDAKDLGTKTLDELRRRGLFPWADMKLEQEDDANVF